LINSLQKLISTRKLFTSRISGLTFEPKWFAEQICFLLLPWLIASVLTGRSAFSWRWRRITVEWILLAWSVVVLLFTFSRTGVFLLVLLIFIGFLLYRFQVQRQNTPSSKSLRRRILEAFSVVFIVLAVFFVVGSQNAYFSRLWRYWTEAKSRNKTYFEFIAVEQRLVYWETALRIFDDDPWLGVGLGNYAFYFDENLPDRPWDLQQEIVRQITPGEDRDRLITPKNLVARLVAETGVFGSASFLLFILAVIGCAVFLWFSTDPEQRYWGMAAFLALIVFAFLVFSFDSFALPNMWVVFGIITAAAHLPDPSARTSPIAPIQAAEQPDASASEPSLEYQAL
jgi:O-antigen ligase